MDKKKIRNIAKLLWAILCCWLYIPHLISVKMGGALVYSDLESLEYQIGFSLPKDLQLIYHLHNNRYYRTLFYHKIGAVKSMLISWYRPGDRYFTLSATTKIGKGMWIAHPYATIINAESIGDNFRCIHTHWVQITTEDLTSVIMCLWALLLQSWVVCRLVIM